MAHFDIHTVSAAALAYLGDSAFEVLVRTRLVKQGFGSSKALNAAARDYVCAEAQAKAMTRIASVLTEEETAAFHRGRNMGHTQTPRHATVAQYRHATGFEALFGYLYLKGDTARMEELFCIAFPEEK